MTYTVEVDDYELRDAVLNVIAERYHSTFSMDRRHVDKIVAEAVRQIIYQDKERIIEMIVERASNHLGNKAVKKILEEMKR